MRVTNVIARVLAGCAGLLLAGAGSAQSPYPDRPVKIGRASCRERVYSNV